MAICGRKIESLINKKFGKLTVLEMHYYAPRGMSHWKCRCDCGNITLARSVHLKSGMKKSCGCIKSTGTGGYLKHGGTYTKEYKFWQRFKRAYRLKNKSWYEYYGFENIPVTKDWMNHFDVFIKDVGKIPDKESCVLTLINPRYGYVPGNTMWKTRKERNKYIKETALLPI